jgi:hypothetical protein
VSESTPKKNFGTTFTRNRSRLQVSQELIIPKMAPSNAIRNVIISRTLVEVVDVIAAEIQSQRAGILEGQIKRRQLQPTAQLIALDSADKSLAT